MNIFLFYIPFSLQYQSLHCYITTSLLNSTQLTLTKNCSPSVQILSFLLRCKTRKFVKLFLLKHRCSIPLMNLCIKQTGFKFFWCSQIFLIKCIPFQSTVSWVLALNHKPILCFLFGTGLTTPPLPRSGLLE